MIYNRILNKNLSQYFTALDIGEIFPRGVRKTCLIGGGYNVELVWLYKVQKYLKYWFFQRFFEEELVKCYHILAQECGVYKVLDWFKIGGSIRFKIRKKIALRS